MTFGNYPTLVVEELKRRLSHVLAKISTFSSILLFLLQMINIFYHRRSHVNYLVAEFLDSPFFLTSLHLYYLERHLCCTSLELRCSKFGTCFFQCNSIILRDFISISPFILVRMILSSISCEASTP